MSSSSSTPATPTSRPSAPPIAYGSDAFIAFSTWKWLEAHRKTGDSPVYRYHFELPRRPSKFHPGTFAFHSDDIEYVFGTLDTRPGVRHAAPEDRKLSEQMMSYWTNFAKTGDPNGPGLPVWPKYDEDDSLIHLDSTITSGPDTLASPLRVPAQRNAILPHVIRTNPHQYRMAAPEAAILLWRRLSCLENSHLHLNCHAERTSPDSKDLHFVSAIPKTRQMHPTDSPQKPAKNAPLDPPESLPPAADQRTSLSSH